MKSIMDNQEAQSLPERYLNGELPLQTELTELPTDEELDAAEAEFDRIVAKRKPLPRRILRWWPMAATAAVVALAFFVLDYPQVDYPGSPESHPEPVQKEHSVLSSRHPVRERAVTLADEGLQLSKHSAPSLTGRAGGESSGGESRKSSGGDSSKSSGGDSSKSSSSSTDSLRYYLARLEAEMQAVDDSVAREHLEQLIATDAHLQQLVQRIIHAEVETAMNSTTEDSTANYLNF